MAVSHMWPLIQQQWLTWQSAVRNTSTQTKTKTRVDDDKEPGEEAIEKRRRNQTLHNHAPAQASNQAVQQAILIVAEIQVKYLPKQSHHLSKKGTSMTLGSKRRGSEIQDRKDKIRRSSPLGGRIPPPPSFPREGGTAPYMLNTYSTYSI